MPKNSAENRSSLGLISCAFLSSPLWYMFHATPGGWLYLRCNKVVEEEGTFR